MLLHLIDATHADPVESWRTIRSELSAYSDDLSKKPEIIALSKCDAAPKDYVTDLICELRKAGGTEIYRLSSITGSGLNKILRAIYDVIKREKVQQKSEGEVYETWHP